MNLEIAKEQCYGRAMSNSTERWREVLELIVEICQWTTITAADMLTINGGDTCNLHYKSKTKGSVRIKVDEEQ